MGTMNVFRETEEYILEYFPQKMSFGILCKIRRILHERSKPVFWKQYISTLNVEKKNTSRQIFKIIFLISRVDILSWETTVSKFICSLLKRNLFWKERICSPCKQILSFQKRPLYRSISRRESMMSDCCLLSKNGRKPVSSSLKPIPTEPRYTCTLSLQCRSRAFGFWRSQPI